MNPMKLIAPDVVFTAPPGQEETVGELHCKVVPMPDGSAIAASLWKPSAHELEALNHGAFVAIMCPAVPPPPITVGLDYGTGLVDGEEPSAYLNDECERALRKGVTLEMLRGALARGYCTGENQNKEMDVELCEAQLSEILTVLNLEP